MIKQGICVGLAAMLALSSASVAIAYANEPPPGSEATCEQEQLSADCSCVEAEDIIQAEKDEPSFESASCVSLTTSTAQTNLEIKLFKLMQEFLC